MLKNGNLTPQGAVDLRKMMDDRKQVFNTSLEKIISGDSEHMDNAANADTKKGRLSWVKYFHDKDKEFKEFLKEAIETNTPIDCSL